MNGAEMLAEAALYMSCSIPLGFRDGSSAVDLECPDTWSTSLRQALEHGNRAHVDAVLANERILGFHCTKLLPHERDNILKRGLRPLTMDLVKKRVTDACQHGHLNKSIAEHLLGMTAAGDSNRRGLIWFVHARSLLGNRSGCYRLFGLWGGEAIYGPHDDPEVKSVLQAMGEPSLVVAAIPASRINSVGSLGQRFLHAFSGKTDEAAFEAHVTEAVGTECIIDILRCSDPRFEALTHYSTW